MRLIKIFIVAILLSSCNSMELSNEKNIIDTSTIQPSVLETPKAVEIDSVTIKKLLPKFTFEKDEFDIEERTWCYPKSRPRFINQNHVYCYFQIVNDKPINYRLKVQYVANDWLFIRKAVFLIDDKPYELIPFKVSRDNGGGYIWEWFDQQINNDHFLLLLKLSQAKTVIVKFYGSNYFDTKKISPKQLQSISETFNIYWAMGGRFN